MSKVREFLEYYAKAAKGVPAGAKAEAAMVEFEAMERRMRTQEAALRDMTHAYYSTVSDSPADAKRRADDWLSTRAALTAPCPVSTLEEEVRAAEARGFERARERAAATCESLIVGGRAWTEQQEAAAKALFACADHIRAMWDERTT